MVDRPCVQLLAGSMQQVQVILVNHAEVHPHHLSLLLTDMGHTSGFRPWFRVHQSCLHLPWLPNSLQAVQGAQDCKLYSMLHLNSPHSPHSSHPLGCAVAGACPACAPPPSLQHSNTLCHPHPHNLHTHLDAQWVVHALLAHRLCLIHHNVAGALTWRQALDGAHHAVTLCPVVTVIPIYKSLMKSQSCLYAACFPLYVCCWHKKRCKYCCV